MGNVPITALDVSQNTQLKELSVGVAPNLGSLDLSNNTQLTDLTLAMSGVGLGQNLYYNYCANYLMPPDYVGSDDMTRLSLTICKV